MRTDIEALWSPESESTHMAIRFQLVKGIVCSTTYMKDEVSLKGGSCELLHYITFRPSHQQLIG